MKKITLLLPLILGFCACTVNKTTTETTIHSQANFSEFKTYRWHNWDQDDSVNQILHSVVKDEIDLELAEKGMTLAPTGDVDFLVNYILNVRDSIEYDELEAYSGYSERYFGLDPYGRYINVTEFQMKKEMSEARNYRQIVKGTLIIDILDPKDNKILMRSVAEKPITEKKVDPDVRNKRIKDVVKKLLDDFPPEPESH